MKRAITGIVAASLTLGTMAPAAFAATASAPSYFGSQIHVGSYNTNVQALKVQDAGNTTALFPFYYIQTGLQSIGYTVTWDGVAKRLDITTPDGVTLDTSNLNPGVGAVGIYINGTLVQRAPFSVANDKGGNNKPTSFMAAYYLNQALAHVGFTNSYDGTGAGWTLTAPVAKLGISSVSALNADQIQVVFSKKVDQTSAENIDNYTLNTVNLDTNHDTTQSPAAGDATAALQADGRTVVLTAGTTGGFGAQLVENKGYVVTVDGVKSTDKTETLSNVSSNSFTFGGDTTAATVASVTGTASTSGTHTVTVKFNEPVQGAGLYYVNGKPATFSAPSPWSSTITLTSPDLLTAGSTYSFQVINEKDSSGNLTSTTQNFTVTSDTAAPTITSVQPVSDNVVKVTFSKAMTTGTVSSSTINVLDANGNNKNSYVQSVGLDANDGGADQTFDVTFKPSATDLFNASGKANLTFVFSGSIQDSLGNALVPASQNVTLALNTVAPAITSVQYVKPGVSYDSLTRTNGAVVVTFNENVKAQLAAGTLTAYKDNGQADSVSGWTVNVKSDAANTLILEPNAQFGGTNSEVLRFGAGAFTDTSLSANTSAAVVETVDLTKGVTSSDTTKPAVGGATGMASYVPGTSTTDTVTFSVYDQGGIDFSTLLNTANYRLNGAALSAGSYVTTNGATAGNTTVTINMPSGSIATNGTYSLVVSGIKDLAGNTADSTVTNTVYLYDNTAPTLQAATFNADHSISLTFNEAVTSTSTGDYSVTVNGSPVTVTGASVGTGSDTGKVVLTTAAIPTGSTVVIKVSGSATGHDANGNVIANGSSTVSAVAN